MSKSSEFVSKCPHCRNDLTLRNEWIGKTVTCPVCQQPFSVKGPASAVQPSGDGKLSIFRKDYPWKRRYFWGFLYILCSRILALVAVLLFIGCIVYDFSDLLEKRKIRQDNYLAEAAAVVAFQTTVSNSYLETARYLEKSNWNTGERVNGLNLPRRLLNPELNFNLNLATMSDVRESSEVNEKYKALVLELQHCFQDELNKNLQTLETQARSNLWNRSSRPANGKSRLPQNRTDKIVIQSGGRKNFYLSEENVSRSIQQLNSGIQTAEKYFNDSRVSNDLRQLKAYLRFIEKYLISDYRQIEIGGSRGMTIPDRQESSREPADSKEEILLRFLQAHLPVCCSAWIDGKPNWHVAKNLDLLQKKLNQLEKSLSEEQTARSQEMKSFLSRTVASLIQAALIALILLLVADFLTGHFDIAYNTKKEI